MQVLRRILGRSLPTDKRIPAACKKRKTTGVTLYMVGNWSIDIRSVGRCRRLCRGWVERDLAIVMRIYAKAILEEWRCMNEVAGLVLILRQAVLGNVKVVNYLASTSN